MQDSSRRVFLWLVLFFSITVFGYGAWRNENGGILDRTLPENDRFVRMDRLARKIAPGWDEFIPIIIEFPGGIDSEEDLEKIGSWTEKAREKFNRPVMSLATVSDLRLEGDELFPEKYSEIPRGLGIDQWKERVRADKSVHGIIVGKGFEWASVVIFLEPGYDETEVFFRAAELVEERKLSWLERLWKTDIEPKDPDIKAGSWVVGRGTIYQVLPFEMFRLILIGIALSSVVLWLILRDRWQVAFSIGSILLGMLVTWGSVGLIDWMGFGFRQRVYILAAFTNCIVQGVSFSLHRLEEFNRAGSWKASRQVNRPILSTALVAIFGFLTLFSFEVLSIREMGILSAAGVVSLCFSSIVLIPGLARFGPSMEGIGRYSVYSRGVSWTSDLFARLALKPAWIYILLLAALVTVSGVLYARGSIIVGGTPLDFIRGSHSEQTARYLNRPGRIGADALNILVRPRQGTVYMAEFVREASEFQGLVSERARHCRRTASVIDKVMAVSWELFGKRLPGDDAEAEEIFFFIQELGFDTRIRKMLWFEHGIRMMAFSEFNSSVEQSEFIGDVLEIAEGFPGLEVLTFGKASLYHREDKYIREGKPRNVLWSQIVVVVFCFFIILMKSGKIRPRDLSPWVGSVVMSVPFVFAISVMAIVMAAFRIPLDAVTAVITALAINAAIDFSIYYVDAYQEALRETGKDAAMFVAMRREGSIIINDIVLNSICFVPLMFSGFVPIRRLGGIMVLMIIVCGIGSLVLMPSVLRLAVRKGGSHETGGNSTGPGRSGPVLVAVRDDR